MKKPSVFAALSAAVVLTACADAKGGEKCIVVDKEGNNLIKEGKSDCGVAGLHDCGGHNKANEAGAYIMVPEGQCKKINAGDFSGVSQDIKDKIEGAQ